jgi:uncharacterized membrane protein
MGRPCGLSRRRDQERQAAEALRDAVLRAGDLLAARFPASRDNPNELSNALAILEANS